MDRIALEDLFDRRLTFPDTSAQRRYARLVGIDDIKTRLAKLLATLVNPESLRTWLDSHHSGASILLEAIERRPPLVLLGGDVGTGKTELAETVGDVAARQEGISITLYPLSLSTRGSGRVGEMTKLISAAFDATVEAATKLRRTNGKASGGIVLLVDEADALTQSREASQMHHEDRAGVNAFIRGVDRLAEQRLPAAVIMCTNRLSAIDPAVKRRAAEIFEFKRPNDAQRRAVIERALSEVGFNSGQIDRIVEQTGPVNGCSYGFTFSDLTQRLLPLLVLDAYPNESIRFDRTLELLQDLKATPPFNEAIHNR
jgi:SpoVK/Ycf46/Vps4 family AAA+-type ATPase